MKNILSLIVFLSLSFIATAQGVLTGQVIDAETKQPLEGASVFAQNTTIGAVTKSDGTFKLALGKGGYELIISFTGYVSQRINVTAAEDKELNIELQKEDNSLSEVVVKSSNEVEDGLEKYGNFFMAHFIGNTPNAQQTVLENPEALKFFFIKRTDKLKVMATEPLRISNKALGYTLNYSLDSFVHYYKTDINTYRGNCLYAEMEGTDEEKKQWKDKREEVYKGSRLHFVRSYYDSTLKQEGFHVDILSSTDRNKFNRLLNPYDTVYYYFDQTTEDAELWFPTKISITYTKQKPEEEYLRQMNLPLDVTNQISYVNLLDAILIKQNGFFFDQRSWINQGYWSWKNVADQLPYDYVPGR